MNSNDLLSLVSDLRRSASRLHDAQYANGSYSRDGGDSARWAMERYATALEQMAIELIKKEAVEAALAQLPLSQTIIVKL